MKNNVIKLIEDQHGNHVVQKCIERLPPEKVAFIVDELRTNVDKMAMHCYGCRVHLASQMQQSCCSYRHYHQRLPRGEARGLHPGSSKELSKMNRKITTVRTRTDIQLVVVEADIR